MLEHRKEFTAILRPLVRKANRHGKSRRYIASLADVSTGSMSNLMNRKRKTPLATKTLGKIAGALERMGYLIHQKLKDILESLMRHHSIDPKRNLVWETNLREGTPQGTEQGASKYDSELSAYFEHKRVQVLGLRVQDIGIDINEQLVKRIENQSYRVGLRSIFRLFGYYRENYSRHFTDGELPVFATLVAQWLLRRRLPFVLTLSGARIKTKHWK